MFARLLEIAPSCRACGLGFAGHDAGDGPAVAGILVLGPAAVALAFVTERLFAPPLWVHVALWSPLIVGGAVALLRPLKGMAVALQYRFRSLDEPDDDRGR